jgi:hypothetical protein
VASLEKWKTPHSELGNWKVKTPGSKGQVKIDRTALGKVKRGSDTDTLKNV